MPKLPIDHTKHSDGSRVKAGELRWWRCPACKIKHTGFSQDTCRTKECVRYGK